MTEKEEEKSMDCVSDQEREIAQLALSEFQKGNYSACLQNIHKLEVRTFDLKVAHNKLVAEYYKNDLRSTETFQKNLAAFYSQFKLRLEKLDDVDHCVAHYNQAVLLYHQKQYTQAIRIMERVYKFIEPMDENLAQQVGLLLVELQMSTKQLDKASGLLSFLENQLFHSHPVILKQGEKPAKMIDKDKKMCTVSSTTIDQFKKKLQMYKARCFLMKHSLGAASEEIEKIEEQSEMSNKSGTIIHKIDTDDNAVKDQIAMFTLQIAHKRVEFHAGGLFQINYSLIFSTIAARFLRANLLYLQGNCEAAMEILNGISSEADFGSSDESYNVILYNNLGTIYHAMGKYHLACHHYQKAIKADIELIQKEKPLYRLGSSRYHELIYNLGISLLHAGRSADAFDCLIIAVRRYHRNSRLWLRLAECCIHVHKESNEIDFNIPKEMKVGVEMIGTKKHQKIVLTKNLSNDKKYSVEGEPYAVPVPTLEFASLCLRNAYLLLPSDTTSPIPLLLIPGVTPPAPPPSPGPAPSVPLSPNSVSALKNSILAASAYVCLCLGDYVLALEHARNLLSQSKLLGAHRLLGHLYAAEALVFLDKIADALEHLNPENVKDIALHFPVSEILDESDNVANNPPSKWFPTNLISARAVIHYNTAVCKTLRGQFDQADGLFKQIWKDCRSNSKVPARLIMLVIYIELQLGHPDVARSLIKEYS